MDKTANKQKGWHEYPYETPPSPGYYRVIAKDGARVAGYWNGFSWQYDIIGSGMKAPLRADDVKFFKAWKA